ncbi:MAG: OadG family protein [Clostridia bacterium]|nr:OadG family protein [Clostridia bacterium]MBQ7755469.1 OadG family protein [Clostridia bacterium]
MLTNMSLWGMAAAAADLPFLTVFVLGFGTVFVGLLALILIITLLGKIMGRSTAKEAQKAAVAVPAEQPAAPVQAAAEPEPASEPVVEDFEDRQSMVAAISAAIATVMGEDVSGIRILSITKVD